MIAEPGMIVERVNKLKYPPTVWANNWIYGLWYCGTSFQKAIYYGQYPSTFVKRIKAMFPNEKMLHVCCGECAIPGAVNVDIMPVKARDLSADGQLLPFAAGTFDVVLIDPPYSQEDSTRYGVKRLINARSALKESARVLRDGGYLLWLDEKYPSYRRADWKLTGLIGIVTGFERRTRVLSIFRKPVAAEGETDAHRA